MKNRILALLLTVLVLSATACASDPAPADTTAAPANTDTPANTAAPTETTAPETTQLRYDAQGRTYPDYTFRIWSLDNVTQNSWTAVPSDMYAAELNGDVLNDAVYERNATVETQLGIKIEETLKTVSNFEPDLSALVLSNTDEVDLVLPRMLALTTFTTKGYLLDLNSVNAFDFSQPWWNQDSINAFGVHDKLYGVVSDASYMYKFATIATFFNQKLVTDYGMGDLYQLVRDGNWTFDKMLELGAQVSKDLDNDGAWGLADAYGISCQNDGCYYFYNSSGLRVCDKDESGNIVFNLNNEQSLNLLQKIYTVMLDPSQYFNRQSANTKLSATSDIAAMFGEDRALFLVRPIQTLYDLRNVEADFGILPTPKMLDGQKEYHSTVNPYAAMATSIPSIATDPERTATILSLLACESHYTVNEPLHETVLGAKLIQNEATAEVLSLVFDSAMFDLGICGNFGKITGTLNGIKNTNIASAITAIEKVVINAVEAYNESLK